MYRQSLGLLLLAASSTAILAGSAQAQSNVLEEVVVTAQKREETAQRAAIAVSVVSPQTLANSGVTTPIELTKVVPALQVQPAANTSAIVNIRGITNFATNTWTDPAVIFNIDGVPIARPTGVYGHFYDLERVEVLKGPQGTLYGRNATGGAINVIPKHAELGKFGGDLTAEVGNYNLRHLTGALNVPVTDKLAVRGAFDVIDREGYMSTGTSDNVGQAGRISVHFEPNERLSIDLGANYYHQGGRGPGTTLIHGQYLPGTFTPGVSGTPDPLMGAYVASDPYTDLNDPQLCATKAAYFSGDPHTCFNSSKVDNEFWGVTATINYDFGPATLTILPAFRRASINFDGYNMVTLHQRGDVEKQTSIEARLTSNSTADSRLKWVVGAFWFDNPNQGNFGVDLHPSLTPNISLYTDQKTTSWATFAQATYSILPRMRVTGGIRYTHDEKEFGLTTQTHIPLGPTLPPGTILGVQNAEKEWDATTWKVGLEFDLAENSLLYASAERGYHSGGFFNTTAPIDFSYEPEIVQAYTIGSKNMFLDRRLQINVEAFHYFYTDQQISHLVNSVIGPLPGGIFIPLSGFETDNIGRSKIWGVEVNGAYKVTANTLLTADVQWVRARYESYTYSTGVGVGVTGCTAVPPSPSGLPFPFNNNYLYDCSGKQVAATPAWKYSVGVQQTFPLSNGGSIVGLLQAYGQSASWLASDYLPFQREGSQWSGDVSLTYNAPEDRWSLTAFVNNFTDEVNRSFVEGTGQAEGSGFTGYPVTVHLKPPRTYGVRASVHF